jgi:hypothetical protein
MARGCTDKGDVGPRTRDAAREVRRSSCTARWCREARRRDSRGAATQGLVVQPVSTVPTSAKETWQELWGTDTVRELFGRRGERLWSCAWRS